jgi:succinoglycan biosynthesis protein ExoM
VDAVYPPDAPRWMRDGGFHSTRPVFVGGEIRTGYTGNVLLRRNLVETLSLRFRNEFGRTGGEDLDFFYRLRDGGGRIGFASKALAVEDVPVGRVSLAWLLRRNFRAGQSHGTRLRQAGRGLQLPLALVKAIACGGGALISAPAPARRNRMLTRGALHIGVVARLAGLREIESY